MNKFVRGSTAYYLTHSNQRDEFNAILGIKRDHVAPDIIDEAEIELIERITRLTGGIHVERGKGATTAGSEDNDFTGKIEHCVDLRCHITILPSETDRVWPEIREIFGDVNFKYSLGCRFLHVSHIRSEAFHCDIATNRPEKWFDRDGISFPLPLKKKGH